MSLAKLSPARSRASRSRPTSSVPLRQSEMATEDKLMPAASAFLHGPLLRLAKPASSGILSPLARRPAAADNHLSLNFGPHAQETPHGPGTVAARAAPDTAGAGDHLRRAGLFGPGIMTH